MLLPPLGSYRFAVSPRALLATVSLVAGLAAIDVALPATAGADATISPPPNYSTAPGLPDNRVYEQVSPADKNGNDAGASTNTTALYGGLAHYALAAPDGNGVLFEGSGPMGETTTGYNLYFEAQRSAAGWSTRAIMPRTQESTAVNGGTLAVQPQYVDPSSDLSHVMFEARGGTFATPPNAKCGYFPGEHQLYLSGPDPLLAATWLARPEISNPIEACYGEGAFTAPVGGTPDFSTVYFTFPGTLLPEDASRAPHVTNTEGWAEQKEPWGFYRYSGGVLSEAGVLPDGSLDQFGAVPARSGHGRAIVGNQIADEGKRAFFVSPDPASCGNGNDCAVDPPELYVRENGEKTVLVSRDTLLPEVNGLPARAPDGGGFLYASPDGSHVFFESKDKLMCEPEDCPPENTSPKMYDFDVNTGVLTYMPGVVNIVVSSQDGSSLAFVNSSVSPAELDLWFAGAAGGTVTPITPYGGSEPARMSSDGSVLVFTAAGLPGFNDASAEIFRYDVPTNTLGCVSCPPAGVTPTSNAELSPLRANNEWYNGGLQNEAGMVDERGVSSNGGRIFFDTADPLVPQASDGVRSVYEWENGTVYLLSSGKSTRSSFFLDNSESGGDVFFATTDGLVPGDTDGAYDVYDARIPHPGDNPPPAAVPCEGSVCQGPPRVPAPLGAPASATFSGLGNIAPEPAATPAAKPKPKATKCKKGFVKKKTKCVKNKKSKKAKKASNYGRTRS